MAFIILGQASQLQIKVPTIGTTDWADTMRTDTFLKIAQHDHSGSGNGSQLGTGSILADAITGAKIRLDNEEFLKARNAADSANVNIIKIDATDSIVLGTGFKNDTYLTFIDNAGTGTVDLIKVDVNDEILLGADVSQLVLKHDTYLQADDSVGTPTNLIKLNTSDNLELGSNLAGAQIINDTFITSVDNAGTGSVNVIKVGTNDKISLGADLANLAIINDTYIQGRNQADSAYIDIVKVNASDKLELGAEQASLQTNTINAGATAVTLTDNTSVAADAGVITLSTDESCTIRYRLVRNGVTQEGQLQFTDASVLPAESYHGTDVGVTFSISSGALYYTTTSTGFNASLYYTILK